MEMNTHVVILAWMDFDVVQVDMRDSERNTKRAKNGETKGMP